MDDETPFSVRRSLDGDTCVVTPEGEVDLSTTDEVREELLAAAAEAATVVLDLRSVAFIDSSGIRLLVEIQRLADAQGTGFLVVRGADHVQRLFDLAGLTSRLTLIDDPGEAGGRDGARGG